MSLYETIKERMQQQEDQLTKELMSSSEAQSLMHRQERSEKERLAKTMIDDVIAERVFLATYGLKQQANFNEVSSIRDAIESAYVGVLPELVKTQYFAEAVKAFVTGVSKETMVTVGGKHADVLVEALKTTGHSAVETEVGDGLGSMRYADGERRGEFTLEDFLNDVKKETIAAVSEYIRQ